MSDTYYLDGKTPKKAMTKGRAAMAWKQDRRVAKSKVGDALVSTVFLVIDHGYGDGQPLFETMIFGGEHDQWMERDYTWAEAEETHKNAVAMLQGAAQ